MEVSSINCMQLTSCDFCSGLTPSSQAHCVHCGKCLHSRANHPIARALKAVAGTTIGGAIAMTLMACYGAAPRKPSNGEAGASASTSASTSSSK